MIRSSNLRTIWRYVQLMASGRRWRGIQGNWAQLGCDFFIGADGIVRLAYRSHDPTGGPDAVQLLEMLEESM
jgi:hypothetical protein